MTLQLKMLDVLYVLQQLSLLQRQKCSGRAVCAEKARPEILSFTKSILSRAGSDRNRLSRVPPGHFIHFLCHKA